MDRQSRVTANNGGYSSVSSCGDVQKRGIQFPHQVSIRVLGHGRFVIPVDQDWSLHNLKYQITELLAKQFTEYLLTHEFDLVFDGKKYPTDMKLVDICRQVDLCGNVDIRMEKTVLKDLKEKLITKTGLKWEIDFSRDSNEGELIHNSYLHLDKEKMDEFVGQLVKKVPAIKMFSDITYGKPGIPVAHDEDFSFGYGRGIPATPSRVTINSSQARSILSAASLGSAASLISQAIRTVENSQLKGVPPGEVDDCLLGRLPTELHGHIASYIGPHFPPHTAAKIMEEKILQAHDEHWDGFLPVAFIELKGVRQSIGATAAVLLKNSEDARKKALKGLEIARVEISDRGMILKFLDADYAEKFSHALKKGGYKTTSLSRIDPPEKTQYGTYHTSVAIGELSEVKDFVEVTCGFPGIFTLDLFKVSEKKIELKKEFFVSQLESIGESEKLSVQEKKDKAKLLVNNYLPYLPPQEAVELKCSIVKLSAEDFEEKPGPLLYLRQHTGLRGILPGAMYSDEVATYKTILEKIDQKISKKN